MSITLKQSHFINMVKEEIEDDNGKLLFNKSRYCGGKAQCNGIFYLNTNEEPIIKVAKGDFSPEEWIGILVHEYCHYLQWKYESKIWEKFSYYNIPFELLFSEPKKHKNALVDLMRLELDCEKRAIKLIKINDLLDYKKYCKTANAVLFKYAYLYHKNKWPKDTKKYNAVEQESPSNLLQNVDKYLYSHPNILAMYD